MLLDFLFLKYGLHRIITFELKYRYTFQLM